MTMFSSASACAFFSLELSGTNMPEDATVLEFETYQALTQGQSEGKIIDFSTHPPSLKDWKVIWATAKELCSKVDTRVAEIYATWSRFESEYTLREKAAYAFKDAGYHGDPGILVTSFGQAAGLGSQAAADRILEQSATLHLAQVELGAVRMRKYELIGLEDEPRAELYKQIIAEIDAIAARVDVDEQSVALV